MNDPSPHPARAAQLTKLSESIRNGSLVWRRMTVSTKARTFQKRNGSVTTAAAIAARLTNGFHPPRCVDENFNSSGAARPKYCFVTVSSPAIHGDEAGLWIIAHVVAASIKTAMGSVQPCSSTKKTRGVVSSRTAVSCERSEG